jgi:hypothetical protein
MGAVAVAVSMTDGWTAGLSELTWPVPSAAVFCSTGMAAKKYVNIGTVFCIHMHEHIYILPFHRKTEGQKIF